MKHRNRLHRSWMLETIRSSSATVVLAACTALGTLAGCAAAVAPRPQTQDAVASVRAAEEIGAPEVPRAALHLKMARDGIAEADVLMKKDEGERAAMVLERARLDAELAMLITRADRTKREARRAIARVEKLKSEQQETP